MRKLRFQSIALGLLLLNGCAWYSRQAWTPDGFNYTTSFGAFSGGGHVDGHLFGWTWNLKRNQTP